MVQYNLCFSHTNSKFYIFKHEYLSTWGTCKEIVVYEVNSHDIFDSKISIESNTAERLHISKFTKIFPNIFNIDELFYQHSLHFNCLQNRDLLGEIGHCLVDSIHKINNNLAEERDRVAAVINTYLTQIDQLNDQCTQLQTEIQVMLKFI